MANELTLSASISGAFNNVTVSKALSNVIKSIAASVKLVQQAIQNIGNSEEAIDMGTLSTPGWALFINLDQTNSIDLKVATGGAIFARLDPDSAGDGTGGFALLKLGSGATAPYAVTTSGTCDMYYLIFEA